MAGPDPDRRPLLCNSPSSSSLEYREDIVVAGSALSFVKTDAARELLSSLEERAGNLSGSGWTTGDFRRRGNADLKPDFSLRLNILLLELCM